MAELNTFEVRDYLAEARDRVTQQFKDKEVFDRYIQLLIYGQQQLQLVFKDLAQNRSIETAEGAQLDLIGEIVGIPRGSLPATAWDGSYFGFQDDATALEFGDLDAPTVGGIFLDLADATSGNVTWSDEIYRIFIKAKIYANSSNGTPNQLIAATKSILNVNYVDIIELGNARMLLSFDRLLSPVEKYILQEVGEGGGLLPIPIGVGVEYIEAPEEFFGFEETPGALGFSSLEAAGGYGDSYGTSYGVGGGESPTGGGTFASLF